MRRTAMLIGLLVALTGCDLLGPSIQDVKTALDAVGRAMETSTSSDIKPDIKSEYINAGNVTWKADDESTVHTMSIFIDTDKNTGNIKGDCSFSEYRDTPSGYTINGTFTYEIQNVKKSRPDDVYGDVHCAVSLTGGKIKTLDVKASRTKEGIVTNELLANGKKIDLEKWDKAFAVIKSLNPAMVPQ